MLSLVGQGSHEVGWEGRAAQACKEASICPRSDGKSVKGWRQGRPSASERLLGGWGGGQEQGDQQGGDGSHPGETAVALTKVQT